MHSITSLDQVSGGFTGTAVTIGKFDGIHLGHQKLISALTAAASEHGIQSAVVTFDRHPDALLKPGHAKLPIIGPKQKHDLIAKHDVDVLVTLPFDEALSGLSPEEFVKQVLVDAMQAKHVLIGDDFRFGARRAGDFALLVSLGEKYGFSVSALDSQCLGAERISSSQVRAALSQGDLRRAEALLGYPYAMEGRVIRGRQLGRTIGVPTANVQIRHDPLPLRGVFVVEVALDETKQAVPQQTRSYPGVANLGYRPTLGGDTRPLLEVHLFDFAGDLYGAHLDVRFLAKLRDEMTFANFEALTSQIRDDLAQARSFFESQPDQ